MTHLFVRSSALRDTQRPEGDLVHSGRQVDVFANSGQSGLLRAEDDNGLCLVAGSAHEAQTATRLLETVRFGGTTPPNDLEGHFLGLVLDKTTGALTVLRDWGGFQHAYYSASEAGFALSTDLHWLLRDGGLDEKCRSVDRAALGLYISLQYIPAPYTFFSGVRQLAPGETLTLDPKGVMSVGTPPRPAPATSGAGSVSADLAGYGQRALELIRDTVANGSSGTHAGAFLSGGMDTSTNIAVMVEMLDMKPLALTAGFREAAYDETPYARAVAAHYGLEHVELEITPHMLGELPSIVELFDSPNGDRAAFAEFFLARAAREAGCDHVYTGEGGDEIMGYPRSRDGEEDYLGLPGAPPELAAWYLEKTCLAPRPWRDRMLRDLGLPETLPVDHLVGVHGRHESYSAFERLYFGQWQTWLVDGVYMKDSCILNGFGIEPVFPFMSTRLMAFMASIDSDVKRDGLRDKRFLKAALRRSLPDVTLTKRKQKFWLPFAEWFRGPARHYLHDVLLSRNGFVCSNFDPADMRELVAEHLEGAADHSRMLWSLLFLELWYHNKKRSA